MEDENPRKYKTSDFIPYLGLVKYPMRNKGTTDESKINEWKGRHALLMLYNIVVITGTAMLIAKSPAIVRGLESILNR